MLRNYLTVSLRNLLRHKVHSLINVAGLAISIALSLLASLYVHSEWTYDQFHEQADSIYRVVKTGVNSNSGAEYAKVMMPENLASALVAGFPEVVEATRIRDGYDSDIRAHGKRFEERILFADAAFFKVFSFDLLEGDPATAITSKNSVVLTEQMARRFFGAESAIGKTVSIRNVFMDRTEARDLIVTGIAADPPENSSIKFTILVPLQLWPPRTDEIQFWVGDERIFVLLGEPAASSTGGEGDEVCPRAQRTSQG
jgi:putative ABC transport system permease protein